MGKIMFFCAGTDLSLLPDIKIDELLINIPQHLSNISSFRDTCELITEGRIQNLCVDSGGFQLLQAELKNFRIISDPKKPVLTRHYINLTPEHVVRGVKNVCKIIRPTMMMALDFPLKNSPFIDKIEFLKKLEINVRWAHETFRLKQKHCPEVPLYIPVQCYDLVQFEEFYARIKDIPFDGLSMPARNLCLSELANFLRRFHQLGVKRVHILGTAKFETMALAAYFARHSFDCISLDATSYRINAELSNYLTPCGLRPEYIGDDAIIDENIPNECPCPWCKETSFSAIKNTPYAERITFLSRHNYWVTKNACSELYSASESTDHLSEYLKANVLDFDRVEILDSIT